MPLATEGKNTKAMNTNFWQCAIHILKEKRFIAFSTEELYFIMRFLISACAFID